MAEVHSSQIAGVALIDRTDGSVTHMVEPFGASAQATGSYNGDYAVWKESDASGDLDNFTVKEWDAGTGAITTVGAAHYTAKNRVVASTVEAPVVSGDHAAWVEGLKDDGAGEIVVLNLRTEKRTIVRRGHPGWLTLRPETLIWAESAQPNQDTTVRAINLSTGKATTPPEALAGARGAWGFVTDGTGWAWFAGSPEALYGAASDTATPVKLGVVPQGGGSPPLAIADGVATAPVSAGGLMVANLATRAWAYEPDASYATALGEQLLVTRMVTGKTSTSGTSEATLSPPQTSTLRCRS